MKRILTALVLIFVVFAILFFGPVWLVALAAALVAALTLFEFRALAHQGGRVLGIEIDLPLWWLIGSTLLLFLTIAPIPGLETQPEYQLAVLSLATFVLFTFNTFRLPLEHVLTATAQGVFALLYIAYPLALLTLIRAHQDGLGLLVFLFVCVWSGDIAAMYIGRRFGRRKLSIISPNKTIEGSIASILGSALFGMAVFFAGRAFYLRGIPVLHITAPARFMILLAVLLNAAAQLGDLLESAIKRGAGVKDSGTMLPGHGGILDRIDALLLAAPVLWFTLLIHDWLIAVH